MPRHVTLAGQLLALQLLIVLGVLAGVTAVSIAQSGETDRRTESRRALSSAENVAANPLVRQRLPVADRARTPAPGGRRGLAGPLRRPVGAAGPARRHGGHVRRPRAGRPAAALRPTRAWRGAAPGPAWCDTGRAHGGVGAGAGVRPAQGRIVGVAVVERDYPSVLQRWRAAVPNLVTYLGIAGALGVPGRCCWRGGSSARPSAWSRRRSPGWWSTGRRCCTGSRRGWSASTRRAGHADQRQRVLLLDLPYDCVGRSLADLPVESSCATSSPGGRRADRPGPSSGDRVLDDEPQADDRARPGDRLGDDPARPHRAERAAARARRRSNRPPRRCAPRPTSSPTSCTSSRAWSSCASTTTWSRFIDNVTRAGPPSTTRWRRASATPRWRRCSWRSPASPPSGG